MYEGRERRRFVRLRAELDVRYKFLSSAFSLGDPAKGVYDGKTVDIGVGGIMLIGKVPVASWLQGLLAHTIVLGVNLLIPRQPLVKSLTRVAWLEATGNEDEYALGLEFREIADESRNTISRYIISRQLPD